MFENMVCTIKRDHTSWELQLENVLYSGSFYKMHDGVINPHTFRIKRTRDKLRITSAIRTRVSFIAVARCVSEFGYDDDISYVINEGQHRALPTKKQYALYKLKNDINPLHRDLIDFGQMVNMYMSAINDTETLLYLEANYECLMI